MFSDAKCGPCARAAYLMYIIAWNFATKWPKKLRLNWCISLVVNLKDRWAKNFETRPSKTAIQWRHQLASACWLQVAHLRVRIAFTEFAFVNAFFLHFSFCTMNPNLKLALEDIRIRGLSAFSAAIKYSVSKTYDLDNLTTIWQSNSWPTRKATGFHSRSRGSVSPVGQKFWGPWKANRNQWFLENG